MTRRRGYKILKETTLWNNTITLTSLLSSTEVFFSVGFSKNQTQKFEDIDIDSKHAVLGQMPSADTYEKAVKYLATIVS